MNCLILFVTFFLFYSQICSAFDHNVFIVNGAEAESAQFPYLVSIRYGFNNDHHCGGAIIDPNWILTAAHCVTEPDEELYPENFKIQVGTNKLDGNNRFYEVTHIFTYNEWNQEKQEHDIALLHLEEEITFDENTSMIELNTEELPPFTMVTTAGWGDSETPNTPTNNLQYVTLNTISTEDCKTAFPTNTIHDTEICAKAAVEGSGTCIGDSGAPLIYDNKIVGVLSWGTVCGGEDPEVYTKVQAYVDWIRNMIQDDD